MSTINYSKWDHIEVSDDEDDTHPNIDTPSLFRWRHQARVERMDQQKQEKETFEKQYTSHQQKVQEIKKKLQESEESAAIANLESLKAELTEMERQEREFKKKEEEIKKKERDDPLNTLILTPWNVDTLCHDGKSKTIVNPYKKEEKELTEEERAAKQAEFNKQHKANIKKFGMFSKYDDSQDFLLEHPELVCEETANYLVLWCIDLEIEEKHGLMEQVSHQTIVMQFILELAKQMELDPRSCIKPFFTRIKQAQKEYQDAFNDELNGFKDRIRTRAKQKIEEAIKEHEEEERQKRLGPGGLDPVEVFESLPEKMKECFESKDIEALQQVVLELPKAEAEYHMKRCVDSGLWVPAGVGRAGDWRPGEEDEEEGEETYQDCD